MKCALAFLLLVLPFACVIGGEVVISGLSPMGKADGKAFFFSVSDTVVKATPVWLRDAPCPPLAPRRAIEIATKQLHELVKEPAKWYFHSISLVDFGDHIHWVYVADFYREDPANPTEFNIGSFEIPVLMSGATLKPKVTDIGPDKN